jgi:hypothetical protein
MTGLPESSATSVRIDDVVDSTTRIAPGMTSRPTDLSSQLALFVSSDASADGPTEALISIPAGLPLSGSTPSNRKGGPMPTKTPKFKTIYADPPWPHQQRGGRGASQHYALMTLDRIKDMPITDLAADDAHLWLWTTNAALEDAFDVVRAWGSCRARC